MKKKFKINNPYKEEPLPWSEYIPVDANKIILGTFPTKSDNRDFEFFYPNRNNKFWKVLAHIADVELTDLEKTKTWKITAIKERKNILDKLNLAITDIGAKVFRQNDSSLDNNLFPIEFTDIFKIIADYPTIKTIILTSSSKGNSVLSWFSTYCRINGVSLVFDKKKKEFPKKTEIIIYDKVIQIVVVYSTSSLAGKTEDFLIQQYGGVIGK